MADPMTMMNDWPGPDDVREGDTVDLASGSLTVLRVTAHTVRARYIGIGGQRVDTYRRRRDDLPGYDRPKLTPDLGDPFTPDLHSFTSAPHPDRSAMRRRGRVVARFVRRHLDDLPGYDRPKLTPDLGDPFTPDLHSFTSAPHPDRSAMSPSGVAGEGSDVWPADVVDPWEAFVTGYACGQVHDDDGDDWPSQVSAAWDRHVDGSLPFDPIVTPALDACDDDDPGGYTPPADGEAVPVHIAAGVAVWAFLGGMVLGAALGWLS